MPKTIKKSARHLIQKLIVWFGKVTKTDLLLAAYQQIGILNYQNPNISGEKWLIETFLKNKFQTIARPTILDVGANVGHYASLLRTNFPTAEIFCFEPNQETFNRLATIAQEKNLKINKVALSDSTGLAKIFLSNNDDQGQLSSLHQEVISDLHHQTNPTSAQVETVTLDDFCTKNQINHIDFLKIDTEGHEFAVLKGAELMLRQNKISIIQFEFNEMNIVSRVFLKDFYRLLPNYHFYRLAQNQLIDIGKYKTDNEIFKFQNIIAILK